MTVVLGLIVVITVVVVGVASVPGSDGSGHRRRAASLGHAASPRCLLRHLWPAEGPRRAAAAYGVTIGHNTVALLMRRAGISGLPLRRRAKRVHTRDG